MARLTPRVFLMVPFVLLLPLLFLKATTLATDKKHWKTTWDTKEGWKDGQRAATAIGKRLYPNELMMRISTNVEPQYAYNLGWVIADLVPHYPQEHSPFQVKNFYYKVYVKDSKEIETSLEEILKDFLEGLHKKVGKEEEGKKWLFSTDIAGLLVDSEADALRLVKVAKESMKIGLEIAESPIEKLVLIKHSG